MKIKVVPVRGGFRGAVVQNGKLVCVSLAVYGNRNSACLSAANLRALI